MKLIFLFFIARLKENLGVLIFNMPKALTFFISEVHLQFLLYTYKPTIYDIVFRIWFSVIRQHKPSSNLIISFFEFPHLIQAKFQKTTIHICYLVWTSLICDFNPNKFHLYIKMPNLLAYKYK